MAIEMVECVYIALFLTPEGGKCDLFEQTIMEIWIWPIVRNKTQIQTEIRIVDKKLKYRWQCVWHTGTRLKCEWKNCCDF